MGDQGNAITGGGGGSSLGSLAGAGDTSSLFNDASLGDAISGGSGDLFGGGTGGSPDVASLFADAGLSSALLGDSSGLGGAFSTTTDPSGSAAASLSTTPPADSAGTPQGSDPSGNIGGTQSGGAPTPQNQQQQTQPPPANQQQPASPLAQLAKMVGGAFGLGAKPTAGGPTGPTPAAQPAQGGQGGGIQSTLANLLPTMPTPAETGELPPGGYAVPPGQGGIGSDAAASASQTDDPTAKAAAEGGVATPQTAQPARPVTPTPAPTPLAEAPVDPNNPPIPPPRPSDAAPAAPAPAPAALPTKKGDGAPGPPEAAPGAPEGAGGPTDGTGGIGTILRDVLGLALANPTVLPMLAQALMGGRGGRRGGIPPWAMHGMMPFMRGRGRGFGGFRGGFLRPGYYPMRQGGGWGFHGGGYHPGWGAWPGAFAGGGGSSGGGGASGGWGAPTSDGSPPNGGQAANATAGPDGATSPIDGVPPDVLNEARQIALQTGGDPNAVADFMRKEGYPEHAGEWCGDFAAAVVKASGGTPPAGSAAAGAWAAYGAPRQGAPQPGDVAVIRGRDNKTGMPYTHVTFVDRVNPDGTFVGLGGNQGGGQLKRSVFPISGADFRVPPANAPATAAAAPAATPTPTPTPAPAAVQSDGYAATG